MSDEAGRMIDAADSFGGCLEDFRVGDLYRHWPGKTITEAEDHMFGLLTMAASPVHQDANYARTRMEDSRNMVVGTYVYALLLGMSVPDISGRALANLGVHELRHGAPLFHGDTLYGESTVLETRESRSRPGTGVLTVRTVGRNQHDEVVCEFTRSVLLPTKEDAVHPRPGTESRP